MKNRNWVRLLSFPIVFLLFAGCSLNSQPSISSSPAQTETSSGENAQTQLPANEPINLRLSNFNTSYETTTQALVDAFCEKNPNVTISLEYISEPDVYYAAITVGLQTGDAPDLFSSHGAKTAHLLTWARSDMLEPLDRKIDVTGFDPLAVEFGKVDGTLYMSPAGFKDCFFIWYNKKVFNEVGIEVPKTYAEFIENCDKLLTAGVTPIAMGGQDPWGCTQLQNTIIASLAFDWCERFANYDAKLTDPEFRSVLDEIGRYRDSGYFGSDFYSVDNAAAIMDVISGKSAMFANGFWNLGAFEPDKEKIGVFYMPSEDGKTRTSSGIATITTGYSVYKDSKNKEAAFDFINYLCSPEGVQLFGDLYPGVPMRDQVTSENEWVNYLAASFDETAPLWLDLMARSAVEGSDPMNEHRGLLQSFLYDTASVDEVIAKTEVTMNLS